MMTGYRSNDAVLTICQNNAAKSIKIQEVNKAAEDLLGYGAHELSGQALRQFVPPRISELLEEYVEFESDANDVGMVLSKVQSFSMLGKDGKESGYRMKVVRAESTGDALYFQLVLQDQTGLRKNEALRRAVQEHLKGHEVIDPETGLPDRYSLGKDIELLSVYSHKGDVQSCLAVLQLDHFDSLFSQYGKPACAALIKHIAVITRRNLRPDDLVCSAGTKRLGVLLLDTTPDSARIVFNRLRWQIAANPFTLPDKTTIGLSVSIAFARIGGRVGDKSLLESCDQALDTLQASANALAEITESGRVKSGN